MALPKLLGWLVLAVVALVLVSLVVSAVFAAVSFILWLVRTALVLAILGGLAYGGYRLYGWLSDDSASTSTTDLGYTSRPENRVKDLQQRYASGDMTESELERQLESELADDEFDTIDRELQRDRN